MSDIIIGLDTLEGVDMVRFQKADRTGYAGFWDPAALVIKSNWTANFPEVVIHREDPYPYGLDLRLRQNFTEFPAGNIPVIFSAAVTFGVKAGALEGSGSAQNPYVVLYSDLDENLSWTDPEGLLTVSIVEENGNKYAEYYVHYDKVPKSWLDDFSALTEVTISNRILRVHTYTGKDPNP